MLSLGCERLPTLLKKKKKKKKRKVLDHYLHHDLDMLPLLRWFFAHLLILQYPDHHQNLISSSLYYSGPVHKISSQSVHNILSNVVHRQTNKQTNRQTNQRYQKHNLLCQGGNNNGNLGIYIWIVPKCWVHFIFVIDIFEISSLFALDSGPVHATYRIKMISSIIRRW